MPLTWTTSEVADQLCTNVPRIQSLITRGVFKPPRKIGGYVWFAADVERLKKLLPTLKRGRKKK